MKNMKNTKTKIILSAIIFLSFAGFVGIASAAGPSLYVSPASLTKTAGDIFSVSVGVSVSGSKVCAVEGTLVFTNLSCQDITVVGDVNPQSAPTCSNPHFLIGAPGCTTADKTLFMVSVKAESAGAASIGFTGVDIIGEGVSVGLASAGGNYIINTVISPTTPVPTTPAAPATPSVKTPKAETPVFSEDAKEDEGKDEGEGLGTKDEVSEKQDDEQVIVLDQEEENNQGSFLAGIAGLGSGGWLILLGIVLLVLCVLIVIRKRKQKTE